MNKFLPFLVVFLILSPLASLAQALVRTPSISPDGTRIAYSLQGDIWTMDLATKKTTRLTVHEAYENNPVWNDSGDMIAFNAARAGNIDIFTIPANGGQSKRITYHSTQDVLWDWTGDQLYFTTTRAYRQIEWNLEIYKVDAAGGTPQRVMSDFGDMPDASLDGKTIALTRGSCRTSREDYNGPADKDIWLYDVSTKKYTKVTDNSVNDFRPIWANDQLFYISASSGRYNIFRKTVSGQPVQLTKFSDDGIRHFSVSANGNKIVFSRQNGLFLMDVGSGKVEKLPSIAPDYRFDPVETSVITNQINQYAISPNGKKAASVIRGEVFVTLTDKEKKRGVNLSKHAYRDKDATWLNDSSVIFVSDREGQQDIYLAKSGDSKVFDIHKSLKSKLVQLTKTKENEANPTVSPDGKQIFYTVGRGKLIVADIDEGGKITNKRTLQDGWDTPRGIVWSPDSKWLAYSMSDLNFNREVYIHDALGKKEPVNISMHPKGDFNPVWSKDGSKLGFVSGRRGGENDVWFVWLNREDWEKTQADRDEGYYFDEPKTDKKEKETKDDKKKKAKPITIDFEDIHERQVRVTALPGNEGSPVISADGETFYFTASSTASDRGRDLYSIKWDGTKIKKLANNLNRFGGLSLSPDGKVLFGVKGGVLNSVGQKDGKMTAIPHSAKMKIDYAAENKQIFEEAWRALKEGFYDPDFHGYNWQKLHDKYKPWCLSATSRQDFQYMFNLMLGQLNASHMGLYVGGGRESVERQRAGLLGAELKPNKKGVEITRIVADTPADKKKSKLLVGETIVSVNGEPIAADQSFYSHLIGTAGEQMLLEVVNIDGKKREVVIRPTSSIRNQLYEEWITDKKALTDKYSNGKLGYIHIRGMNLPSFERFERELMASGYGKEGIVIDVRFNGGGWTTDYLMTVLSVKQHAYTIPRGAVSSLSENPKFKNYYPFSERLPLTSWTKPSVAMCNESSYSNAEIFSHAYKNLKIGKLVGMPTFGAVISTGGMRLIDGSFVRMPFRAWYVKATGENMENGPAVPDIAVQNTPGEREANEDTQLKKAVETLLSDLK